MTSAGVSKPPATTHTIFADAPPSVHPRKRRRRTGGGGAQDDCFACRKIGATCDRKRPYCTQCINIGKECTGYKTTLTWGVGVASRGKLRGLSLPVANKHIADRAATKEVAAHESKRRKSSVSNANNDRPSTRDVSDGIAAQPKLFATSPIAIPNPRHRAPTSHPVSDTQSPSWHTPSMSYSAGSPLNYDQFEVSRRPHLEHIQTSLGPRFDSLDHFSSSASSTGSFADADFHTPVDYITSPSSYTFPDHSQHPFTSLLDSPIEHTSSTSISFTSAPLAQIVLSSQDILNNYTDGLILDQSHALSPSCQSFSQVPAFNEDEITALDTILPAIDARFSNHLFHLPQRLQALINYYDTSICPFLVAFDSPQNPYRMHIIQLASHNEGLQNALAALATNNMRMRRMEHSTTGFIECSPEDSKPSAEELRYKQLSIEQLNSQLVTPSIAQDDSVLATLLILCLFHVCDSGFSKFKTQLAGVQKLMSLRDSNTKSPFTGWVEMFFIWFDVMTAAVNNREPQIKGESLDMMDYSVNLGALEQYSGCDGRLFKLLARLGGLSLLAQGRTTSRSTQRSVPTSLSPDSTLRSMRKSRLTAQGPQNRSLNASDYDHLDGNGWGASIFPTDEDLHRTNASPNDSSDFWREWNDIRAMLQAWKFDTSTLPANPAAAANFAFDQSNLTSEQQDLMHISESFRFSALLYTERLAYPLLPSSASCFQQHVVQALYHITSLPVTSCVNKFLLWPLFITGTECVDDSDRAVVRSRCVEIQQESGFYNNISCLRVLEKVWADVDMGLGEEGEMHARRRDSEVSSGSESRQAFRWRRAMDRVDGEYLII